LLGKEIGDLQGKSRRYVETPSKVRGKTRAFTAKAEVLSPVAFQFHASKYNNSRSDDTHLGSSGLNWPGKMKSLLESRPQHKYYLFHQDHNHDTEDCYTLQNQLENMIKKGKQWRFVAN
jgi:hypothetical protein